MKRVSSVSPTEQPTPAGPSEIEERQREARLRDGIAQAEALVDFLREHPYDIDLRKVDSLWFMDLIALCLQRSAIKSRRAEVA